MTTDTLRIHASLLSLIAALAVAPASGHAESPAGRWIADAGGQIVALDLRADGTGSLAGERGRWRLAGQKLVLSGGGGSIIARYSDDRIELVIDGVPLTFRRAGGRPAGERLRPFRPDKTVSGRTVRPAKSGARFTAPRGWRHGWGPGGKTYYVAAPSGGARVAISRTLLSARDRAATVPELLARTASDLLEGAPARPVVGPEAFTVGGQRAGRLIARGYLGGAEIEGYLGGVIAGDWAFVIAAVYRADAAGQIRPGVDTILASFRGRGPAPNRALARRLQGCWTQYHASSGGVSNGSSTTKYRFGPGGRYSYRFYMSVSAGGASAHRDNRDAGTFAVFGDTLSLQSDKGKTETWTIRIVRGGLQLDGTRYIPCN